MKARPPGLADVGNAVWQTRFRRRGLFHVKSGLLKVRPLAQTQGATFMVHGPLGNSSVRYAELGSTLSRKGRFTWKFLFWASLRVRL